MELLFTLNDGIEMPKIGLGLWEMRGDDILPLVRSAVHRGYRLFDTAQYYKNETDVGRAIAGCGAPRERLFITSKVWPSDMTREGTTAAVERSLRDLGLDYLDMYLLHWPIGDVLGSWDSLIKARERGLVRSIGVSNFMPKHLDMLLTSGVAPAINQIESNPHFVHDAECRYTKEKGIIPQAWGPLGKGRTLSEPVIAELAAKYRVSPARLILRWHLQRGLAVIPKTATVSRLSENMNTFGFVISDSDMARIASLDRNASDRYYPDGFVYDSFGVLGSPRE